ncbi:MAG: efflux RND transporter periplasmic adaptor subunit [Patescibacteria group bacterium]
MKSIKEWWLASSLKKKIFIGIIAVLAIALLVYAFSGGDDANSLSATVQAGDVTSAVVLSGTTQSSSAVSLGFADQGRIAAVRVKEGQKVSAGQVLATLDAADLYASLKNAQASLVIAKATATNTTTNVATVTAQQDTLVDNAYNALLSSDLQATPKVLSTSAIAPTISGRYGGPEGQYVVHAYASGTNSGASFSISGLENGYINEVSTNTPVPLGSKGLYIQFSAGSSYAGSDWIVSIPNKQSSSYAANLNAYNAALAARTQAIATAQASLNANAANQSVASAQIAQAQASVDGIIAQIQKRQIVAPFDGVVAAVSMKPGQTTSSFNPSSAAAESGNASISLISENDYEVVLKTPEIDVASLAVGQSVSLALDAFGADTAFPGTITSINPAETVVDGVPVYQTKVAFTKLDSRIRSGMSATATITVGSKTGVLTLPASYIHADKRGSYVYVLNGKKTEQQPVTTGLRGSDSVVEITSGLALGQTVVADER